jgi:hypothetical protein
MRSASPPFRAMNICSGRTRAEAVKCLVNTGHSATRRIRGPPRSQSFVVEWSTGLCDMIDRVTDGAYPHVSRRPGRAKWERADRTLGPLSVCCRTKASAAFGWLTQRSASAQSSPTTCVQGPTTFRKAGCPTVSQLSAGIVCFCRNGPSGDVEKAKAGKLAQSAKF